MDRILIILKKENGPRASSAPALGLNTIMFKYVYWYMKQISGERLQDHWSSCFAMLEPYITINLLCTCIHCLSRAITFPPHLLSSVGTCILHYIL